MTRSACVAVLACLIFTPAAHATSVTINGPWWAQEQVDRMRVPVTPDQTVILAPCPGYESEAAACNFPTRDSPIYIDPASNLGMVNAMRRILLRELGGRFVTLAMYPYALQRFERLIGHRRAATASMAVESPHWYAAAELFEDAYADCAMGLRPLRPTLHRSDDRWDDSAGYDPTRRQHTRVCRLIDRVGARAGYVLPAR